MHAYGEWIRMIQIRAKRVGSARTGALSSPSCTCMKNTTQSGLVWQGYDCAQSRLVLFLAGFFTGC